MLSSLQQQRRFIADLVNLGWGESRIDFSWRLERKWVGVGLDVLDTVRRIENCVTDADLKVSWGSTSLEFTYTEGQFSVQPQPDAELDSTFSPDDQDTAILAFSGDTESALSLQGEWEVNIGVDLSRPINEADPTRRWVYAESASHLESILASRAWWNIGSLVEHSRHVVFLMDHESGVWCSTPTFSLTGWQADLSTLRQTSSTPRPDAGTTDKPPDLPSLDSFCIKTLSPLLPKNLHNRIRTLGSAVAWAQLASRVDVAGEVATIEFFGYQRATWTMGPAGPTIAVPASEAAISLARWASDEEPDKLLAIRQVVSLNKSDFLWDQAREIRRATEPVFVALRSSAIAEAMKSIREARGTAVSVARQTSDAATSLSKGAIERSLATFAAIFGVIVARAGNVISIEIANLLRMTGAIYLSVLAVWVLLIEGPLVTAGMTALKHDVGRYSDFISENEANLITSLDVVQRARRQAWIVRIMVPLAYIAAGLGILVVAR